MEKKIKAYEIFIAHETVRELSDKERDKLIRYHCEMMENFQHERLIHLIVTLFFALFAIVAIFVSAWIVGNYGFSYEMIPLFALVLVLVVLTGFYVKHYYFLENHVQGLYKYTEKLMCYNK